MFTLQISSYRPIDSSKVEHLNTSMNYLPPELLIEIFVICSSTGDWCAPLILSRVCRLWREIVNSSPRIWEYISVQDSHRGLASIQSQAELWVMRAAPLPCVLDIELGDMERLLPVMSCFLPSIRRWSECIITCGGKTIRTSLAPVYRSAPRRVLHYLDVHLHTQSDTSDSDDDDIAFSSGASRFRFVSMKVTVSRLPIADIANPLLFTSIDITDSAFEQCVPSSDLLKFLSLCPQLEHFCFHGTPDDEGTLNQVDPVVALPRLHSLRLDYTCSQRNILSHLHLPALRELHIRHTNVDFPLEPYHYIEDGDSEDEFPDFSQSRWSDQHTGMGLRKLISRSNPPLELLDMDLSDMRTKDFRWVFDRLPDLTHFSIVGSDMSDTVVRLLAPFEETEEGLGDHQHLRLPQLSVLRLSNCQQFWGDAVVEALSRRVQYTDEMTPNSTLREVVIAGCGRFTSGNTQELSRDLGARLHVTY
ncbi:hypothetical protein BJ138DRAFT_1146223 [Hygrophoropsis aurantiaca]|uniref:Uncharacterized protein n=1 Tax=Hygrophoropsis aurantiaca TaxID=72124 RepID=A0ACB8AJD8_9AGAM|nr:hypothetical protein BJ138DRAFT_1146223 [Hygrophoropsis aurantiaca]